MWIVFFLITNIMNDYNNFGIIFDKTSEILHYIFIYNIINTSSVYK